LLNQKFMSFEVLTVVLMKFLVHVDWCMMYKTEILNQNFNYHVHISPPMKYSRVPFYTGVTFSNIWL